MIEKVKLWCEKQRLLQAGDTVLIACSGGPDSLALLDVFLQLRLSYQLRVAAAHLDHMFRGAAASADAAFVAAFCKARGVAYYERQEDVAAYAKKRGLSAEDAARRVRYAFLRETASLLGGAKIATGHHRDDQAETVLMHFLRGAGGDGMAGMKPVNRGVIRPFLSLSRAEIDAYCRQRGLTPRTDLTNFEDCYLRNRIRLELLPHLERLYNPLVKAALCRSAELLGDEHDFVRICAREAWEKAAAADETGVRLFRDAFNGLHIAVRREVLRFAVSELRGDLRDFAFAHIEKMVDFAAQGRTGAVLELPKGVRLQCRYSCLRLYMEGAPTKIAPRSALLQTPGCTETEFGLIEGRYLTSYQKPKSRDECILDMDKITLPLRLRTRRDGDRFRPAGMQGSKKLKDFFIDCKIEREARARIPLLCDQNGIVWVVGWRQSEDGKATEQTKHFLFLQVKKVWDEKGNEKV